MSLGKNFLAKLYRRSKPKEVQLSLASLIQAYEPVLRTLNCIKPGEILVAADVKDVKEDDLFINIYVKKEAQSRTRKD